MKLPEPSDVVQRMVMPIHAHIVPSLPFDPGSSMGGVDLLACGLLKCHLQSHGLDVESAWCGPLI